MRPLAAGFEKLRPLRQSVGVTLSRGRTSGGRVGLLGGLAVVLGLGLGLLSLTARLERWPAEASSRAALQAATPELRRDEGFVGSNTCVACHPGEHASWAATYHRTMTQEASAAAVLAPFDGRELIGVDGRYRVERRGEEFWVRMVDPEWKLAAAEAGEALSAGPEVWRRVVMTTGSHHLQVYWVTSEDQRRLLAFPFSYLIGEGRWVANESTLLRPPEGDAVYTWNQVCIQCHAVVGVPGAFDEAGPAGASASAVAELGIACEACHGPGEEHTEHHRDPTRRYGQHLRGGADPTIINPARLPHDKASELCGQCHSAAVFADEAAWRAGGPSFRPGGRLEPDLRVVRHPLRADQPWLDELLQGDPGFVEGRLWGDGMIRVVGREFSGLLESPCYQRGELSCLSCHQLHGADPNDQLAPAMDTDAACTGCHSALADPEAAAAHTHHAPDSPGHRCMNCHMPNTTYGLLSASRSHEIAVPEVDAQLQGARPNACNLCHLDQTLGWTTEHLRRWYDAETPTIEAEHGDVAAGLAWAVAGDANQRALIAWHMGWRPALDASGDRWVAPILALLLEDPYDAVRYIAGRSLARLPGYEDLDYDYVADPRSRAALAEEVRRRWRAEGDDRRAPQLLRRADGSLHEEAFAALLGDRDLRPIDVRE